MATFIHPHKRCHLLCFDLWCSSIMESKTDQFPKITCKYFENSLAVIVLFLEERSTHLEEQKQSWKPTHTCTQKSCSSSCEARYSYLMRQARKLTPAAQTAAAWQTLAHGALTRTCIWMFVCICRVMIYCSAFLKHMASKCN